MNLDELRFDWDSDAFGVSTSLRKSFSSPDEPVDEPYYIFYDGYQHDTPTHSVFVFDLLETCWLISGIGVPFINALFELASIWYNLEHHNRRPYHICVPIYLPKRHAGPPRVQLSRSLSSHGWHAAVWIFTYIFVIACLAQFPSNYELMRIVITVVYGLPCLVGVLEKSKLLLVNK